VLQRWGGQQRSIKDIHLEHTWVYRYRCTNCGRTFRHYPEGISSARQSERLAVFAGLCWMLGLSLRATSAILSVFPAELSHTSVWRDVQALSAHVKRNRPKKIRVLGVDGVYPKLVGKEQPTVIVVDMGTGKPVAVWPISEKDWRAVVKRLGPLAQELGVEVIVTDDLKELAVAAERLELKHQVCHFHLLRWLWHALEKLRPQLGKAHQDLIDEIWQLAKGRPAGAESRLFAIWKELQVRRVKEMKTSALYRLRLLVLRLQENWQKYTLDQAQSGVPPTNNATERAIGRWRVRSHSTRGFKSWDGLEASFLVCGNESI
jgi:transposase-like protein